MSHFTFLFLQVMHDLELRGAVPFAAFGGGEDRFPLTAAESPGD